MDDGLQPGPPSEVFGADDRLGASNYLQGLSLERLAKYLGPNAVAISLARKSRYDDPSLSRSPGPAAPYSYYL